MICRGPWSDVIAHDLPDPLQGGGSPRAHAEILSTGFTRSQRIEDQEVGDVAIDGVRAPVFI